WSTEDSFRFDQAKRGRRLAEPRLQVAEARVEVIELGAGLGDLLAAGDDSGQEVFGHLVAAAGTADPGQPSRLAQVQAERAERDEHTQPAEVCLLVVAVPGGRAFRGRQESFRLVKADGTGGDAGTTSEFG